jgi:glutamate dehydrogenase
MSAVGATPAKERLLRDLLEQIAAHVPPERVDVVSLFARAYARRFPEAEAAALSGEELFGQVMGVFELAESRGRRSIAVRAFTPTLAGDGYTSVGSILETNTPDSPFLVDSISEELAAHGLSVRLVLHPVVAIERDEEGRITGVKAKKHAAAAESVTHFEVDRHLEPAELDRLAADVTRVLADVQRSVGDFPAMLSRLDDMIDAARAGSPRYDAEEIEEAVAFLEWLRDENLVLLGYREYAIEGADDGRSVEVVHGSGLGILRDEASSGFARGTRLADLAPAMRQRVEGGDLLAVSKTNRTSTVHRRARMDYVGVKRVGADGSVTGELRLLGLFTSKAYMEPAESVPIARRKLQQVLTAEDLAPGSHDYKVAVGLIENFPLDELLSATPDALRETVVQLLELQEQRKVRLFAHRDIFERSVSLLVALPRDRFNAELRQRLQHLFMERFHGSSVDYHLALGETDPAQIHFRIHVTEGQIPDVSFAELEQEVADLARTWDDRLLERLVSQHGEELGRARWSRWEGRLPEYYKSSTDITRAVLDIEHLERLGPETEFVVALQNERGVGEQLTRVLLYKAGARADLSTLMPVLEALGLVVVEEVPVRVAADGASDIFIHDFGVVGPGGDVLDVAAVGERVADAVAAVWRGRTESDRLDRLVVLAGLTWREVSWLRAMRTYLLRVSAGFTVDYQNDAFAANPALARDLVRYFELRHDPAPPRDEAAEMALRQRILEQLEAVPSLDQDRILRSYLHLIEAIVRTNAFRPDRNYLSFKIRSAAVPDMPKPTPLCEIFVHSTEMEGIHLRAGRVARGGIRWSDRMEDYRTEVLGLMKTQTTKNAVIVPTGSKGGFVVRRGMPPDELRAEVLRQYVTLVHGLLDVTDNLVAGEIVHPPGVRILDEDDPYLVVAADKGTATFSDVANGVSEEHGFWLGDAFASGGSAGYDHKALGITARGAWESVKRHFRELGRDALQEPFTAVGVGDMSGDVFGNGMLYSDQTRLVAAFDHRHVFVDPAPDAETSLAERRRLFDLPGSSWDDYDRELISPGGGVWPRSAKSIEVSPEAAAALSIEPGPLTPTELIRAILCAPVDLFWNGGIGTYVRASDETDTDAGDRTNDAVRVTGSEMRALVVGEGGNLGFTQGGRIEYANAGGRINTDFIDNSGGVDCSDHEVNLKILLGIAEARGDLTRKQRDELLAEVAGDVVRHVLYDNYLQAQILSQEAAMSASRIRDYEDLMAALEAQGLLDRAIEQLPPSEETAERARTGAGMARPELAVLLSYAKLSLKTAILHSSLPDDPFLARDLRRYFPGTVVERFGHLLDAHPLRRELIATMVAKDVVDSEGITFVSRAVAETGAEPADVARAYRIAREVTAASDRWAALEALDGVIDPVVQNELMTSVDWVVGLTGRWFLQNAPGADITETIAANAAGFAELDAALPDLVPAASRAARAETAAALVARGAPEEHAVRHAYMPALAHAPDVLVVVRASGRTPIEVARAFFTAGQSLQLDWLENQVLGFAATSRWEQFALDAILDDLLLVRREVVQRAITAFPDTDPVDALGRFLAGRPAAVARLGRLIDQFRSDGMNDLAVITIALRQVRGVIAGGSS